MRDTPEEYEKSLRIGVRVKASGLELLDGRPLPKLRDGAVAELLVAPEMILDPHQRNEFIREIRVPLLGVGTELLVGVSANMLASSCPASPIPPENEHIATSYLLVKARLIEPLDLWVRGDQEAWLADCKCLIPSLEREAKSLNDAFTMISVRYEVLRRTHSGNVFTRIWARKDNRWQRLDSLRVAAISKHVAERN